MFALLALAHAEDLYVSSNERGAAILLNGVDTGYTTPATIPGVKPGRTLVTVEGGCARGETLIDVLPGLTTRASIVATEQLGTLSLVPVPANARLELDSAPFLGSPGVPLAVSCGEHTVRAALEGYVTAVVTVDVGMGQDLSVPLALQKLGIGTLELSVSPRSATLYLDGKPVGSDAVTLPSVYQGVHTVSAELDGYQSARKQVAVEDGGTQAWHFELARASQKKATSTVTLLGGTPEPAGTAGKGEGATPARKADPAEDTRAAKREAAARAEAEAEREAAERDAEAKREAAEREAEEKAEADRAAKAERTAKAAREAVEAKAEREAESEREAEARAEEEAEREAAALAEAEAAALVDAEAEREAEREAAETAAREAASIERAERREAERREAARKEAAKADIRVVTTKKTTEKATSEARITRDGPPVGKTIGGVSLLAAGVASGVFGAVAYDGAYQAYEAYSTKVNGAGADKQQQRLAEGYYDDTVVPRQNLFYGSAVAAGLFLAGGVVVLVIDERAPALVPAPGGGMLLWSGKF